MYTTYLQYLHVSRYLPLPTPKIPKKRQLRWARPILRPSPSPSFYPTFSSPVSFRLFPFIPQPCLFLLPFLVVVVVAGVVVAVVAAAPRRCLHPASHSFIPKTLLEFTYVYQHHRSLRSLVLEKTPNHTRPLLHRLQFPRSKFPTFSNDQQRSSAFPSLTGRLRIHATQESRLRIDPYARRHLFARFAYRYAIGLGRLAADGVFTRDIRTSTIYGVCLHYRLNQHS
ncbi:hypothetical protein F5B22DRAFT_110502 [Xylaria bambusicola]|uniref:uncharacterized protein n=1 Tax=Xylaria bambusicola TaxID=326684 RepID=UPI002008E083|nr:uncharacterized protein F5B22DRAFT_110502 [Xylaria bambusicola]KAI0517585.1 hypothetical protein F5B22DRAFT_110502 [Xylaria bambusicola]